ncbi:MAG: hypothetical protein WC551_08755 [Patescibacteria group bacterium]
MSTKAECIACDILVDKFQLLSAFEAKQPSILALLGCCCLSPESRFETFVKYLAEKVVVTETTVDLHSFETQTTDWQEQYFKALGQFCLKGSSAEFRTEDGDHYRYIVIDGVFVEQQGVVKVQYPG